LIFSIKNRFASCLIVLGLVRSSIHQALATDALVTKIDLEAALDRVTLRMTVRFGVMLVAGIGVLAALQKLS
jgi:hypothetical protein